MNTKALTRIVTLIALFAVPLFPIIISYSYFFPFITGKAFLFRVLVEVAFAGWIMLTFMDAKYRPRVNALTVSVTVFALVALVADLLGVNPIRSIWSNFERMEGWLMISHLWMLFMAVAHTFGHSEDSKIMWRRWFNWSLVVASYVGLYALLQWTGEIDITQSASRLDATLGNAAYLAVYMLMHVGIAVYLFVSALRTRSILDMGHRWVYALLAIVFSAIIFGTSTRGTLIGLAGGVMLTLFLYAVLGSRHHTKGSHAYDFSMKMRIASAVAIVVVLLSGFIIWMNRDSSFVQENETLRRMTSISFDSFKTEGRAYIWPMAIKGAMERPVLGWGQENFNYIFNANYNPAMWGQEQWFDRAHNVYLDWLVSTGFVGLLAYLALYVVLGFAIWKADLSIAEKSVLTGLMAGYAIHNVFVFDNLASYAFFFAILAYLASLSKGRHILYAGGKSVSNDAVNYVVLPIVGVALVFGIYFLNIRSIEAGKLLIISLRNCDSQSPTTAYFEELLKIDSPIANQEAREQILQCTNTVIRSESSSNKVKNEFYELANRAIADQIAFAPNDARIYALSGQLFMSIGHNERAIENLNKALELSPRKQSMIYDLATAKLNLGQKEEAIALLKETYESSISDTGAAKFDPKARLAYAMALVFTDQEEHARQIIGNDPEVFMSKEMAGMFMSKKEYDKAIAIYKYIAELSPEDVNKKLELVQAQYAASRISDAVATLREMKKDFPEYSDRIEQIIIEVEKGSVK